MRPVRREILSCPACKGQRLRSSALKCGDCGTEVHGSILESEFNQLNSEELHFLRVFVHSEGKIKDMEKALGISYPSVKAQLQQLKKKLSLQVQETEERNSVQGILKALDSGDLSYEEAMQAIRNLQ